ncbi:hypothetical protein PybrP1_011955 [[Pythium] brassicae (nom. inval.)]|nr:hypothetical protein PybrP1_011955 [[Pythium] brassicae (nom. inval.)]
MTVAGHCRQVGVESDKVALATRQQSGFGTGFPAVGLSFPDRLPMDPGLVTSELPARGAGRAPAPPKPGDLPASPSITCRACRVQVPVDSIESHECRPDDLAAAAARKSSGVEASVLAAATRVSGAFVDSWLGFEQESVRHPERAESPPALRDQRQHQFQRSHSSSSSSATQVQAPPSPVKPVSGSPTHLSRIGRSVSAHIPGDHDAAPSPSAQLRQRSLSSEEPLIQCRVKGVRVNKARVALYSITSSVSKADASAGVSLSSSLISALGTPPASRKQEVIIERRYREFYAFALTVYAMFPSKELWSRLPPKTLCFLKNTRHDGFLLRRKHGLDDFIQCAIKQLSLGTTAQGTIGQWYLVRKFLNLPATLTSTPTKDRSLASAMEEIKENARQSTNWIPAGWSEEHDAVYEKTGDGFAMIKRVRQCPFPARAIFDMVVRTNASGGTSSADAKESEVASSPASSAASKPEPWNPLVESEDVLRREDGHTWVERSVFKAGWVSRRFEMISLKSWRVEDSGTIVIAMIPADDRDCSTASSAFHRVDCVVGGWVITPTPNDETCFVTWLMQANFGECDPCSEFTGLQGSRHSRKTLLAWADEIAHMLSALEVSYAPAYYRALGPLMSSRDLQQVKLEQPDASSMCVIEDPRVYALARELEPSLCLLIHKNTNKNALIFKTNLRTTSDLDPATPVKAEWFMFEKNGNPRQDLSPIERSTTYHFATKLVGPSVHHFRLELIRRDCVLRYDPQHGFALFTTINGKPNTRLKRVFVSYAKASSMLSFPKIEGVTLIADTDVETVSIQAPKTHVIDLEHHEEEKRVLPGCSRWWSTSLGWNRPLVARRRASLAPPLELSWRTPPLAASAQTRAWRAPESHARSLNGDSRANSAAAGRSCSATSLATRQWWKIGEWIRSKPLLGAGF